MAEQRHIVYDDRWIREWLKSAPSPPGIPNPAHDPKDDWPASTLNGRNLELSLDRADRYMRYARSYDIRIKCALQNIFDRHPTRPDTDDNQFLSAWFRGVLCPLAEETGWKVHVFPNDMAGAVHVEVDYSGNGYGMVVQLNTKRNK
jgi:hypothetical protein